jgi:outer membrane protein assembly factor BamB
MMRFDRYLLSASQRLNSVRLSAKGAMQLLPTLLVVSLCLFPNLAAAASPHIYDVPQVGPPGSQTTTVGNGWDPNATLDVYLDSTDVGLVVTDSNGSFGLALKAPTLRQNGLTIQIPKDAVPGQHWITAIERITEIQAQVAFTVQVDWAQLHFGPERTGFNPYEYILDPETVPNLQLSWSSTLNIYSPVVANGVVYVSAAFDGVYALDASTGAQIWKATALSPTDPPAVANGVVYVGASGYIYALNAGTGAVIWLSPTDGGLYTALAVANNMVYSSQSSGFYVLDANTGELLWKYNISGSTPAVANGVVYFSATTSVYALDARTGAFLWQTPVLNSHDSPAVANGMVYVSSYDGSIHALDASTGALLWSYQTSIGYGIYDAPAVANGVLYVGCVDNNLYALNASTGALLWKFPTGDDIDGSPGVANGVVYVGSYDDNVYALNANTGALLWKYTTGGLVASSPAVVNGMLYIGSGDGNLYAFGLPSEQMSEKFSPPERPDPARLTPDWNLQPNTVVTPAKK